MAPSKLRKALGAVKDKTSISLAKVGSSSSISDLDVAIVKATRHEEYPADEKYVREILTLTSYSSIYITSCVSTLSRRLNKTHSWTVALKTLILIHRLLSQGVPACEQEIFFATRRGTRLLNLSDFRDTSHSNSWDYSAFVRTFALYLDEKLDVRMFGRQNRLNRRSFRIGEDEEEEEAATSPAYPIPVQEMMTEQIFTRIQQLQQLLERFLACRPTGNAKSNRVVIVAMHPIVKESFQIYYDIAEIMAVLIDRFMELEISDCMKVFEIFSRLAKQFEDLESFYNWCKSVGVARSSEFPVLEKITAKKLEVMDEFIHEKSVLEQRKKDKREEPKVEVEPNAAESPIEDDPMNIKALPAPEEVAPQEEEKEETKEEEEEENQDTQEEADFLNLREDEVTGKEQGDKLALALFAGELGTTTPSQPAWEAFKGEWADWETALVQSASNLSNQKASLGGGFNTLLLDGMYKQAAAVAAGGPRAASGSASSMAFLGGTPGLLALPAPPAAGGGGDPFAASLMIPAPSYVQMSDMEKKQKLLVEEQLMWQQYARDGMQGHLGMANSHSNPAYAMNGGYTRSF